MLWNGLHRSKDLRSFIWYGFLCVLKRIGNDICNCIQMDFHSVTNRLLVVVRETLIEFPLYVELTGKKFTTIIRHNDMQNNHTIV